LCFQSHNSLSPTSRHIILFDGVCNLCNGVVQFIIKRDKEKKFRFASLQSNAAIELLKEYGSYSEEMNTIIYIRDEKIYYKSNAALFIMQDLGGIWKLVGAFRIFPLFIRNTVYDLIAKWRYRIFGKKETCMIPTEDIVDRFL